MSLLEYVRHRQFITLRPVQNDCDCVIALLNTFDVIALPGVDHYIAVDKADYTIYYEADDWQLISNL